jgi:hypothetical protein
LPVSLCRSLFAGLSLPVSLCQSQRRGRRPTSMRWPGRRRQHLASRASIADSGC